MVVSKIMIVALLILIVAILLFGAATVKGWIRGSAIVIACGFILLIVIGLFASRYAEYRAAAEHAELVEAGKTLTLKWVARAAKKPASALVDVTTYDTDDFFLCGSIARTSGYGGPEGRQRFLSNGGGITEFEEPGGALAFDQRTALYCTNGRGEL